MMNSFPPCSMVPTTSATSASRSTISSTPNSRPNSKGIFMAHKCITHNCAAQYCAILLLLAEGHLNRWRFGSAEADCVGSLAHHSLAVPVGALMAALLEYS